jgi:hypothetical protein
MRLGLLLSAILIAVFVVPAATAQKPIREVIPAPADFLITGQCDFPVLAHIEGNEIDTTFTDKAGNPVRLLGVFPGNMLTLTSATRSITLPATGSFQARANPDGSVTYMVTGHGPWVPNPITEEKGIWYQSGQLSATFDAQGNMVSMKSTGTLPNLCSRLAP